MVKILKLATGIENNFKNYEVNLKKMSQFNQMFNDTVVYLKFIKTEILVSHENEIYAIWKVQNLMVGRYYEEFFKGSSKKKKIKMFEMKRS